MNVIYHTQLHHANCVTVDSVRHLVVYLLWPSEILLSQML